MKTIRIRYSVTFNATLQVPDNATPQQIADEAANVNIPEDENSKYQEDTFKVEGDGHGGPQLFDEDWNEVDS